METHFYGTQDNKKPAQDRSGWVFPNANGVMPIKFGLLGRFAKLDIYGGPFRSYRRLIRKEQPHDQLSYGVCLLEKPLDTADASMPIRDFSIPTQTDAVVSKELIKAYRNGFRGRTVYAGCMGGIGRTGVFLALMAKIAGHKDPVAYVRSTFLPHAVETGEQKAYIADFDVSHARRAVYWEAWKSLFSKN